MFAGWKQKREHREALQSFLREREVDAAKGQLAGPILHLRERGKAARTGAGIFLGGLIITVVFGLAFYLGQPFWKQWADSKRSTLTETIGATEAVLEGFDMDRKALQTDLVKALAGVGDRLTFPGSETVVFTGGLALDPDTALFFGTEGSVIRWTRTGGPEPRLVLPGSENVFFTGGLALDPDTALLYGDEGTVISWTRADGPEPRLVLPGSETVGFRGGVALDPDTALLFGDQGTVIRWTRAGGPGPRLVLPGLENMFFIAGLALVPDTALLFGREGRLIDSGDTVIRISDFHSDQATALVLLPRATAAPVPATGTAAGTAAEVVSAPGSDQLSDFINDLPPEVRALPLVQAVFGAAQGLVAQEKVLERTVATTKADLLTLDQFPHSFLQLEKQREDFAAFMKICRDKPLPEKTAVAAEDTATTPPAETASATPTGAGDAMTLACLTGWKDQRDSETQAWWQAIATQLPPGILLLFLLSTLAALYRYNLRLSGFHHSRADALELMAMGKTKEEIEQLKNIAEVLAADKVVFGRTDTATKQAVDIIKAVRGTSDPV